MKKVLFSTPAIIVAIITCLIGTVVCAAPGIEVIKSVSSDGETWLDTGEAADLVMTEGDTVYYRYDVTNTGEEGDPTLSYELTDSDFMEAIGSGDIAPGDTETLEATGTVVLGEHSNTATVEASYTDETTLELITLSAEDIAYYYGIIAPETITIDIKPGSDPNSINLRSKGVVPVALISTPEFDATTILEGDGDVYFAGVKALRLNVEDVDGDGDLDVICHFNTEDLNLGEDSVIGVVEVGSNDEVIDDIVPSLVGEDAVNIVPNGQAKGHSKSNSSNNNSSSNNSSNKSNNGKAKGKNK